jgi:ornithine cyclodeaminase/alanine dehydrogenase-like protein (mu-crystallin family)
MSVLYLSEADVEQLIAMPMVIEVMREAFQQLAAGQAHNVPRQRTRASGICLHSMSASADYLQVVGWKQYTTTRRGARFHVGLYGQLTGEMLALIEANRLGQARTGAVTGLAIDLLVPAGVDRLGLIGTGWQAESQLEAAAAVRPLRVASVYSRNEQRRVDFCRRMSERLNLEVTAVEHAQRAVTDQPLVITATTSATPVLEGSWLARPALVCAAGSNWKNKAELDMETIRRADRIVCDDIACCQLEAGDFVQALAQGVVRWSAMQNLAEVVQNPAATDLDQIVVFKSVGMALEDVALAAQLLELAQQQGLGRALEIA